MHDDNSPFLAQRKESAEINMIPLIDVMLVLLIVFMITAPMMTHTVKIDLPQASSTPTDDQPKRITLAINGEGEMFWDNQPIVEAELESRLAEIGVKKDNQEELHLRADRETKYEQLATIMSKARQAGIKKMGFITRPGNDDKTK